MTGTARPQFEDLDSTVRERTDAFRAAEGLRHAIEVMSSGLAIGAIRLET